MKKLIVIGGGIAGLSAGIYGCKAGFEVELYEKNPVAGGECMGWDRKGHHIDNCIHWLTGTRKGSGLRKVWEEIGALSDETEFASTDQFFTSRTNGESITLWKDLERTKREMLQLSPADQGAIEHFIQHVTYAMKCEMPVEKPFDKMNLFDYIKLGREMSDMPKVIKAFGKINVYDLSETFQHPVLKNLFKDYIPTIYQASAFIVSYATIVSGNGEIPAGGSLQMVNRIVKRFQELGGKLILNSEIQRINVEGNKAVSISLQDGRKVTADYMVYAADTFGLFNKLLDPGFMSKHWQEVYEKEEKYPLFSGFQTAFSIDREAYHESGTIAFDCKPFEINKRRIVRMSLKSFEYEEKFAPIGKTVLQSNIQQFDEDYRYWKSLDKESYYAEKGKLAELVKDRITEVFPALKGHIELLDCFTPVTYERYCNAYHGAYMSFMTRKDVKSFHDKGIIKGVNNLFIAGQWLQAPGGLPTAAVTGKFAVQRILGQ